MSKMPKRLAEGLALHQAGRLDEAERVYAAVLETDPRNADAQQFLGLILLRRGDVDGAVARIERAVTLNPKVGAYHYNLGVALQRRGDASGATASYRRAVGLAPDLAEAHNNLGNLLRESGAVVAAVESCRRAASLRPDWAEAHLNLGTALQAAGRFDEALASFHRALGMAPNLAEAHYNLGSALQRLGRLDEALTALRRAITLNPDYSAAWNNLAAIFHAYADYAGAMDAYRKVADLAPEDSTAYRNLLGVMLYSGLVEEERFALARGFEARYGAAGPARVFGASREGERRLRLGYVSSDFYEHPVGRNLEPVLAHGDRARFEVVLYADVGREDATSARLKGLVARWQGIAGWSDARVAEQVRADGIDILVLLAGRFDRNRPLVASHRAAPVQVSFHDPGTSGLEGMDYLIADRVLVPGKRPAERFTERVVRLPSFYVHAPLAGVRIGDVPSRGSGRVRFGSFNNPAKVGSEVLALWRLVLEAVPGSVLRVRFKNWFGNAGLRERFERGLGVGRVEFETAEAGLEDHLGSYNGIDVALDPYPFTGSTTTFEALWMGVPVVTLLGRTMAGRWSASMLRAAGLGDLVAATPEAYVGLAAGLAGDEGRRAELRRTLRGRIAASPLCDGPARARQLERLYRALWKRWCATA
jgi:predicted O-linked N-acetylglucosamine transferase (SPINDLY family)